MKLKKGTVLIAIGLMFILAAVCLVGHNIYREQKAEDLSRKVTDELSEIVRTFEDETDIETDEENTSEDKVSSEKNETEIPDYILNPKIEMPTVSIDGNLYIGILKIPSLNLELPVMSEWSYPGLNISPCRYQGSAYTENMVIAAHNYVSHFASLQYIEEGSEVTFTDVEGNTFYYTVAFREILEATAVEDMTSGEFPLTLFTCNNAGFARITVRCESAE